MDSLMQPDPVPLDEALARQEIESQVRADYEKRYQNESADERAVAETALSLWRWVAIIIGIVVGIPLLGAVLGLFVRLFRLASGIW